MSIPLCLEGLNAKLYIYIGDGRGSHGREEQRASLI